MRNVISKLLQKLLGILKDKKKNQNEMIHLLGSEIIWSMLYPDTN